MLRIIPNVVRRRDIDVRQLGWLDGRRAGTRRNFPANLDYVDLRGLTLAQLDMVLAEEQRGYALLETAGFAPGTIADVDRERSLSPVVPILDFGIASTVVGLSALGCVPVMSCRGRSLGPDAHMYPAPMATFYARRRVVPTLLAAVAEAGINIVNSDGKLEVYSEDLRRMHAFGRALRHLLDQQGASAPV